MAAIRIPISRCPDDHASSSTSRTFLASYYGVLQKPTILARLRELLAGLMPKRLDGED